MIPVTAITILIAGMVIAMPALQSRYEARAYKRIKYSVFAVYLLGNLFVTLLSRNWNPTAMLELDLFSAYRKSFELDYGIFGTLKHVLSEGFPAGVRLVTTEPLEGVILNILLYIPMGYLLPVVWPTLAKARGFLWRVLFIGFFASLLTESIQLIFHLGWFDLDDLLNNTLGTVIGIGLYKLITYKHKRLS